MLNKAQPKMERKKKIKDEEGIFCWAMFLFRLLHRVAGLRMIPKNIGEKKKTLQSGQIHDFNKLLYMLIALASATEK